MIFMFILLLDECFDYNDDCATWATSSNCKYQSERALGCQKSCGKCVSKDACQDKISNCNDYTFRCDSPYSGTMQWVLDNCAKTCNKCTITLPATQTSLPAEPSTCENWDETFCKAMENYLDTLTCNNAYLRKYCKKM